MRTEQIIPSVCRQIWPFFRGPPSGVCFSQHHARVGDMGKCGILFTVVSVWVILVYLAIFQTGFYEISGKLWNPDTPGIATSDVIAIGDVHGDVEQMMNLLKQVGVAQGELVPFKDAPPGSKWVGVENVKWLGGAKMLVSVGDIFNRGPYGSIALDFFEELSRDAERQGGRVVNLLGNHEHSLLHSGFASFAENEITRMAAQGKLKSKSQEEYFALWSETGEIGTKVRNRFHVAQRIGSSIFVHAGFSLDFMNKMKSENISFEALSKPYKDLDTRFSSDQQLGILWDDSWGSGDDNWCDAIAAFLKQQSAKRIVHGHIQHLTPPEQRCDGRVVNIDVGLSRWAEERSGDPEEVAVTTGGVHVLSIAGDDVRTLIWAELIGQLLSYSVPC